MHDCTARAATGDGVGGSVAVDAAECPFRAQGEGPIEQWPGWFADGLSGGPRRGARGAARGGEMTLTGHRSIAGRARLTTLRERGRTI